MSVSAALRIAPRIGQVLMVLLLSACGPQPTEQPAIPLAVEAVRAVVADGSQNTESLGDNRFPVTLRHDREAQLSFRIGGPLIAMPVRSGQRLPAGTLAAAIDATPYAAAVAARVSEVERLSRAAQRYHELAKTGAVSAAQALDAASARDAARAQLLSARYDLTSARLHLPFAGVVLRRDVEVGEVVLPGTPVATLIDENSTLLAEASVPGQLAAHLVPGIRAAITLPGQTNPIFTTVRHQPGGVDPKTGSATIELVLNPGRGLISGMTGSVAFAPILAPDNSGNESTVLIPAEALVWVKDDRAGIFTIDGHSRAHGLRVRFLGFTDDKVVIAGLAPGTRVITAGAGYVTEGQKVDAVEK